MDEIKSMAHLLSNLSTPEGLGLLGKLAPNHVVITKQRIDDFVREVDAISRVIEAKETAR